MSGYETIDLDIYTIFKDNNFFIPEENLSSTMDIKSKQISFLKLRSALGFRMLLFIDSLHDFHDKNRYTGKQSKVGGAPNSPQPSKRQKTTAAAALPPYSCSVIAVKELFKKVCKDLKYIIDSYKEVNDEIFSNKQDESIKLSIKLFTLFEKIINLYASDIELNQMSNKIVINPLDISEREIVSNEKPVTEKYKNKNPEQWNSYDTKPGVNSIIVHQQDNIKDKITPPDREKYEIKYFESHGKITILTKDFYKDLVYKSGETGEKNESLSYYTQAKSKENPGYLRKVYYTDGKKETELTLLQAIGYNLVNFYTKIDESNKEKQFIYDENFCNNSYMFLIILILTTVLKDVEHRNLENKSSQDQNLWISKSNLTTMFHIFLLKYTFNCYNLQIKDREKINLNSNAILGELCKILCLQRNRKQKQVTDYCNELANNNISFPFFDLFEFFINKGRAPKINLMIDAASKNRSTNYIYESALDLFKNNITVDTKGNSYLLIHDKEGVKKLNLTDFKLDEETSCSPLTKPYDTLKKIYTLHISTATCYDAAGTSNIENFIKQMQQITQNGKQEALVDSKNLQKSLRFNLRINDRGKDISLMDILFQQGNTTGDCSELDFSFPQLQIFRFFDKQAQNGKPVTISTDSSSLRESFNTFYSGSTGRPREINYLIGKGMGDFGQILYFYYLHLNTRYEPVEPINLFHTIDQWAAGIGSLFTNGIVCEQQSDSINTDSKARSAFKLLSNQFFVSKKLKEDFNKISFEPKQKNWTSCQDLFWKKVLTLNKTYREEIQKKNLEIETITNNILDMLGEMDVESNKESPAADNTLTQIAAKVNSLIQERAQLIENNSYLKEFEKTYDKKIEEQLALNRELYNKYAMLREVAQPAGTLYGFQFARVKKSSPTDFVTGAVSNVIKNASDATALLDAAEAAAAAAAAEEEEAEVEGPLPVQRTKTEEDNKDLKKLEALSAAINAEKRRIKAEKAQRKANREEEAAAQQAKQAAAAEAAAAMEVEVEETEGAAMEVEETAGVQQAQQAAAAEAMEVEEMEGVQRAQQVQPQPQQAAQRAQQAQPGKTRRQRRYSRSRDASRSRSRSPSANSSDDKQGRGKGVKKLYNKGEIKRKTTKKKIIKKRIGETMKKLKIKKRIGETIKKLKIKKRIEETRKKKS
jgi:hypothetical protein